MLTLPDLVANHSISAEGADVLRGIGSAGQSFLVYALPRNAGKSTVTEAIVAEAPAELPRLDFYGTEDEAAALIATPSRAYLRVGEIGHRGRPGYLAGEEVVRLFDVLATGTYSLASSLHADSVDEVFAVLLKNGVSSRAAAAAVSHVVKVRALGDPDEPGTQRVVEQIHAIRPTTDGEPSASLLYQWTDPPAG